MLRLQKEGNDRVSQARLDDDNEAREMQRTFPAVLVVSAHALVGVLDLALAASPVRARAVRRRLRKVALAVPPRKDARAARACARCGRDHRREGGAAARARDGRVAGRRDGRAGRVELLPQARVLLLQPRVLLLEPARMQSPVSECRSGSQRTHK